MRLCLLDVLELQVALGQTGVCLHLLELQGVLALFLLHALLGLTKCLLLDGLLQPHQVLLLILNAALKLSLQVVQFSDLMRDAGLALSFCCPLRDGQSALKSSQRLHQIYLDQILCLLDVNLDEFLADESHHFCALILGVECAGVVKGVLEDLDGLISLFALVVALAESQQCHQFELFVLDSLGVTLQEAASSMTF